MSLSVSKLNIPRPSRKGPPFSSNTNLPTSFIPLPKISRAFPVIRKF